jgi:amino acid transporter
VHKGLRKEMGLGDLTMASLGAIIGSGWLFGALASAAIAGPGAVLAWVIGGIAVMLIGLVYAELGGMLPESGAIARYPQYTHGSLVSFIMGWGAWIAYASVPAIEAEAVVQYTGHWIPSLWNTAAAQMTTAGLGVAALLMLIFFLINYYGIRTFARINTTVTWVKFIMPAATIIVFLLFTHLHWGNYAAHGGFEPNGFSGVLQAVATGGIVFSYLGFRQAVDLSGEAKRPQRDVPRAIITAIGIGIVLYVLLQLVFTAGIPPADIAKYGWAAGLNGIFSAPFAQLALSLNLGWFSVLLYADAILSPAGTGNIYTASTTRVIYALSNNRYFPKVFSKVDERTGIPRASLILAFILGLVFLAPFPSWQSLVGVVSSATVFTYIIGPISAGVFRRTAPDAPRPYKLGGLSVIAPIAFIIGSLIIYWTGWATDSKLLIAVLIGIVLYAIFSAITPDEIVRPTGEHIRAGIWLVVYLLFMLGMSYYGAGRFGSPYNKGAGLIHYPLDLVVVAIASLIFYYWGIASGLNTDEAKEALANVQQEAESVAGGGVSA